MKKLSEVINITNPIVPVRAFRYAFENRGKAPC